jgi:hypothetical protein
MGRNIGQSSALTSAQYANPTEVFGQGNIRVFYNSETFTTPSYAKAIKVRVWGAGGSGAYTGQGINAVGGAGGGYSEKVIVNPSSTYSVTIGAGGIARANNNTNQNGAAGGTSSFGSECSATGGAGGVFATSGNATGASGGTGSSGDFNYTGGNSGTAGSDYANNTGGGSAAGPWGNGFASGSISGGGRYNATGGAGIGGSSCSIVTNQQGWGTAGGGSIGPSVDVVANFAEYLGYPSGPGASGFMAQPFRVNTGPVNNVAGTMWYGVNGVSDSDAVFPIRYPGDMLPQAGGAGGGSIYKSTSVNCMAGYGGYGAGGGAATSNGTGSTIIGGRGGMFGGGGSPGIDNGNGYYGSGGAGGIAAGGGTGGGSSQASGAGGNGLVVVEW